MKPQKVFWLIIIFIFAVSPQVHAEEWYVNYEKGVDAVRNQLWQNAVNLLNDAIEERSDEKANAKTYGLRFIDYFPYLYRGIAYYHLGKTDLSRNDLQKSSQSGEVREGSNDRDAASLLDKYLKLVTSSPAVADKLSQALALFNKADYAAAISGFNEVLALDPANKEAKEYLRKAKEAQTNVAAEKTDQRVKQELAAGVAAFSKKDFAAAETHLKNVLAIDKSNNDATTYLRRIKTERDHIENIGTMYQAALRLLDRGGLDRAESEMKAILRQDKNNKDAKNALQQISDRRATSDRLVKEGVALLDKKQTAGADTKFLAALDANGDNITARNYHTQILNSTNTTVTAQLADSLIRLGISQFDAGLLKDSRGSFQSAGRIAKADIRIASYIQKLDSVEAKIRSGVIAFFKGQYDKSIQDLSSAAALSPGNETPYAYLACAYGTKYLLSGAEDDDLHSKAITAFHHVTELNRAFQFDHRYISPRIIALFTK